MKTQKLNKKGFTLVELVVVVAVIAVLSAILIPTIGCFVEEAKETNDMATVRLLNTALVADEAENGKPVTMTQALAAMDRKGYNIEKLTPRSSGDILWDSKNNRFMLVKDDKVFYCDNTSEVADKIDLWKVVETDNKTVADIQTELTKDEYSHYLKGESFEAEELNVSSGIDVGQNSGISVIKYKNSAAKNNNIVISTNGGKLVVDDNSSSGKVYHYGKLNELNIIDVAPTSYHEYGTTMFIQVKDGRVVLEDSAEVGGIHLVATDGKTSSIIIATVGNAVLPYCTRDDITMDSTQTLVFTLQQLNSSIDAINEFNTLPIYVCEKQSGCSFTEETEKLIKNIAPQVQDLVNTTSVDEAKEAASLIIAPSFDNKIIASIGSKGYETMDEAIGAVQSGDTIKLEKNVYLEKNYTISNKSFVFDGNDKEIVASPATFFVNGSKINVEIKNIVFKSNNREDAFNFNISNGSIKIDNVSVEGAFKALHFNACTNISISLNKYIATSIYPFNVNGGIISAFSATNCEFNGWTSFSGLDNNGSNSDLIYMFANCKFGKGMGYATLKPYVSTTLNNCTFSQEYLSGAEQGVASGTNTPISVRFNQCKVIDSNNKTVALTIDTLNQMFNYDIKSGSNSGPSTINDQYWFINGVKVENNSN